eukprot:Pgem_evm1s2572
MLHLRAHVQFQPIYKINKLRPDLLSWTDASENCFWKILIKHAVDDLVLPLTDEDNDILL